MDQAELQWGRPIALAETLRIAGEYSLTQRVLNVLLARTPPLGFPAPVVGSLVGYTHTKTFS
jgi:hypothetical protein